MNELAIDLYQQASKFAYTTIGPEHADSAYFRGTVVGKFSELLVQECAEYLTKAVEVHNQQEQELLELAARKLKQHFGVQK